jgi:hypothetical protein
VTRRLPTWAWAASAALAGLLPFLPGLTGSRVFYIRDLSMYFWGRYLWLRHAWLSGEWPLWDPYVGAGQAAYSDALNQMFLLPAVLARLAGGEVLGFNLWVALPFPLGAIGAFGFFARRFSAPASALGAIAFALCGPVVSTGNFPNLSWSVAAMPWVLWATDAVVSTRTARPIAALALAVALQAFAGEPVSQFATLIVALLYAVSVGAPDGRDSFRRGLRHGMRVAAGIALGVVLAAIQLVPMAQAASRAGRAGAITQDFWSLRPTAIVETVWLHLFGNYYNTQSLVEVPWMPLMFTGREPFFFSVYFGVPLMAVCVYGFAGSGHRPWRLFWVAVGFASLVAAFGAYTPIYPIFRDYVPLVGSFRFPVKYLVVVALAVAAGVATGWDALASDLSTRTDPRRVWRARVTALGFATVVGSIVGLLALACVVIPAATGDLLARYAVALGARDGMPAAEFMLRTFSRGAVPLLVLSLATVALLWRPVSASWIRPALYLLIVGDLLVRAWGINPVMNPVHLAKPAWLAHTEGDPNARFYVGGKKDGTLDPMDIDASRAYVNAPGLAGSASRAALSIQAAYYPSAWRSREMLSYDLAVLWPRLFTTTSEQFMNSKREERDRFLDRTGVRFRILPSRHAPERTPVMPIPYFLESFLYDWGPVTPRMTVVADVRVVPDVEQQVDALFEAGWDSRTTVLIGREPEAAGVTGPPVTPFARLRAETSNRVVVEAGAGPDEGYLVLLDSYSPDWRVMVDGRRADMVQANGFFRAVRLTPGHHEVEFVYRPRALAWGAAISGLGLVVTLGLLILGRNPVRPRQVAAGSA